MQNHQAIDRVSAELSKLLYRQTLMNSDHISMPDAFDKLVEISQRENMKLREVAERITEVEKADLQTADGPEND